MAGVKQFLWIPGPLPGLNEIILAASTVYGSGKRRASQYSKMKKSWGERIKAHGFTQRFRPITSGCFSYLCVERERRRDPSNITAGAVKLIEDGLQEAELLSGDGWTQVRGIHVAWCQGETPGVLLRVTESDHGLEWGEMVARIPGLTAAG